MLLVTLAVVVLLAARLREALRAHELSFATRWCSATASSAPPSRARFILADGRPALLRILSS